MTSPTDATHPTDGPGPGSAGLERPPGVTAAATGEDPQLLPFLPLIYVAWADGDLSSGEIATISDQADCLEPEARRHLQRWLDPEEPPPAGELEAMLGTIRRSADQLPRGSRSSLASLGAQLASLTGGDAASGGAPAGVGLVEPQVREALERIEAALGVAGDEVSRALLAPVRRLTEAQQVPVSHSFEPLAMTRVLEADYREVRGRAREVLARPEFVARYGLPTDEYRAWTTERVRELAAEGFGALGYAEEHGGAGDLGAFIAAFETFAYGDLSLLVKFGVQFGLFGGSILQLGTEKHHEKYLKRVGTMELPGCFAMSETGHGSNVRDLGTVARYEPESGEFVVDTPSPLDRKDWIGNAARDGRLATVFAQLEVAGELFGVHAFLVPIRGEDGEPLAGVTIEDCGHKEGLNGVDNGRLLFDGVRIPRENLLDRFGSVSPEGVYESPIRGASKRFFTMLGTLVAGRISVGAAGVSASKVGLSIALRYGELRRQFGPAGQPEMAILDYQTHQRRLLPRLAGVYAQTFGVRYLVERFLGRTEEDAREVEALAAGIKAYTTWDAIEVLQTCRECCGGQGYLSMNRFGTLKNHTDIFTTFEGDNTVLSQLVTRGLLATYKQQFGDMSFVSMVRYVADRATSALEAKNPITTRRTDDEHLRDPEFQLAAFRYREEHQLTRLAQRLKKKIEGGMDSFDAFNESGVHAVSLSRVHIERVILEQFNRAIEACEDEGVQPVLVRLRDLWALWRLEEDRAWFLENGLFEGSKAKAIRNLVLRLCSEVRPDAVALVEAFAIPDETLAAPIAFGYGTGRSLA